MKKCLLLLCSILIQMPVFAAQSWILNEQQNGVNLYLVESKSLTVAVDASQSNQMITPIYFLCNGKTYYLKAGESYICQSQYGQYISLSLDTSKGSYSAGYYR